MATQDFSRYRGILILLLLVIIVSGGIVLWIRYPRSQTIEISLSPPETFQGEIHISGAVVSPGIYPLRDTDSVDTLIRAAGGMDKGADRKGLKLYVPQTAEKQQPQKVDINRAEAWLLKALPDIGDTRAKAIIEYRNRSGGFKNTHELARVDGLGGAIYEKIKDMVTIGE